MVSISISDTKEENFEIKIQGKRSDLTYFAQEILKAVSEESDHIHFFHHEWGGDDLDDTYNENSINRVTHVKIIFHDDE
jgi:hypothetical protein